MPKIEKYCDICDNPIDDCDCEEYCEDCNNLVEECECDDEEEGTTLQDVNNFLDTANKGLDFLDRLKKQPEPPQPKTLTNDEARFIGQDIERKRRKKQQEDEITKKMKKESDKKWKIETIVKIAVPIAVALIGAGFFILN